MVAGFWWFKKYKSNQTSLGIYYAKKKKNAGTVSLQNIKGSFEKENTNANDRLEYKVPNLKQKTYDKRQTWKQNQQSSNSVNSNVSLPC